MSDRWFQAAEQGDAEALLEMLGQGMDVDAVRDGGSTALMLAVRHRRIEAIEVLLAHGASLEPSNGERVTALNIAAFHSLDHGKLWANPNPDPRPLDMLLEAGARLGLRDAVYLENVAVVRQLLDEGADPNTGAGSYDGTVLMDAARLGNVEIINLLLDHGANIEETDDLAQGPLLSAAWFGRIEAVRCLIARGAEIDAGWWQESALAYAAIEGHREVVELLLSLGARRGIIDALVLEEEALLAEMIDETGREDIDFLWHGADRIAMLAASRGNPRILGLLLDRGAAHLVDHDDHSLLAGAARNGHAEVVRLLIERGADLHAVGRDGLTPLAWAVREGRDETARALREAGAVR